MSYKEERHGVTGREVRGMSGGEVGKGHNTQVCLDGKRNVSFTLSHIAAEALCSGLVIF